MYQIHICGDLIAVPCSLLLWHIWIRDTNCQTVATHTPCDGLIAERRAILGEDVGHTVIPQVRLQTKEWLQLCQNKLVARFARLGVTKFGT